jgi:hypothetical protein
LISAIVWSSRAVQEWLQLIAAARGAHRAACEHHAKIEPGMEALPYGK